MGDHKRIPAVIYFCFYSSFVHLIGQCVISPLPKLFGQSIIASCFVELLRQNSHRLIHLTVLQVLLGCSSRPDIAVCALEGLIQLAYGGGIHKGSLSPAKVIDKPGADNTGVYRDGSNGGKAARQLACVQDVSQLALAVANPRSERGAVLLYIQHLEDDSGARVHAEPQGGEDNNADISTSFGGPLQQRQAFLDQQGMAQVVSSELYLVVIPSQTG